MMLITAKYFFELGQCFIADNCRLSAPVKRGENLQKSESKTRSQWGETVLYFEYRLS